MEGRAQQARPEVLAEEPDLGPRLVGDVVARVEVDPLPGGEGEDGPRPRLVLVEGHLLLERHPLLLRDRHDPPGRADPVRGLDRVAVRGHREPLQDVEGRQVHLGAHAAKASDRNPMATAASGRAGWGHARARRPGHARRRPRPLRRHRPPGVVRGAGRPHDRGAADRGAARPAVRGRPAGVGPGQLPRHLRRTSDAAVGPGGRGRPAGAHGRPHLGRRPPRPPAARGADRDDAPPRRADPPRGRRALRAARERAGHLRQLRLRAGVAELHALGRPRDDLQRAGPRRRRRRDRDPAGRRLRSCPGRPGDGLRGAGRRGAARVGRRRGELLHRRAPRDAPGAAGQGAAADAVRDPRRRRRRAGRVPAYAQVGAAPPPGHPRGLRPGRRRLRPGWRCCAGWSTST